MLPTLKLNSKANLGDKCSLGSQELGSQLDGIDDQGVLGRSFRGPGSTDVGRTIMKDQIESRAAILPHEPPELGNTLGPCDVLLDRVGAAKRSDGDQIDADDNAAHGHALHGDLHPTAGGGAEVEDGVRGLEEPELGVELKQLP